MIERRARVGFVVLAVLALPACSSDPGDPDDGGGSGGEPSTGSGGRRATGGAAPGSGGTSASGGAASSGGAFGSGETSGLDPSRTLSSLTASEINRLCNWAATRPGIGDEVDCSDGSTVTITGPDESECKSNVDCAATVGDVEACYEALFAEPCDAIPAACSPLIECSTN